MKVLVADDIPENVYMLEVLLKHHGYEVSTAVNGKEALEKLKLEPASLIISDILMPKMDGFQLCRAVKADAALKNIPFIFYTSTYTTEKDKNFALSLGADRFILKPTDPEKFSGIIKDVLAENTIGLLKRGKLSVEKETEYLKGHQARLIKKLDDKIAELERSEERYRSLIACAMDAIITLDESGMILSWTDAAEKMFGYEFDEVIGQHFSLLVPEDLQAEQEELIARLKERKQIGCLETVRRTKSGMLIPVGISLGLMKDKEGKDLGISAVIRDMSERKKAEQFVQDIFQSMGEGLAVLDRNFKIIAANPAYSKMAGLAPEEIKGRACYEVSHHHSRPCGEDGFECPVSVSFRTGGPFSATHRHEAAGREPTAVEVRSYPLKDRSGEVNLVIAIVRDVSANKRLEAQLLQSQKMEAIGRLAGGVAHDFNNILTAIIGYGSIAQRKVKPGDSLLTDLDHILESANRASELTRSLLAFSRKQIMNRQLVDVNEIINRVEKFLRRIIGEDIELKTALKEGALTVDADRSQLEQVLMNLGTNARDAMPDGGAFSIETDAVVVDDEYMKACDGITRPGTYAVVSVSDSGIGMNEATRKQIFEPFFTTKGPGKGTGLGLSIIYGIIRQHNGFITVDSEPEQGTIFRIYLPLAQTPVVDEKKIPESIIPLGGAETILLAEDDTNVRELSRVALTEFGYTVITAKNGEDAVRMFTEHQGHIHLLILDAVMPRKTGEEVYEMIKKKQPDIKALFMSGYAVDSVHMQRLLAKGMAFIQKPIAPMPFLLKVREVLDRR